MKDRIASPEKRGIIQDFAKAISSAKRDGVKPETTTIPFRNEKVLNISRPVYLVPVNLLRFREENGRIASDVESYIKFTGPLEERSEKSQEILREFLENKDPERTEDLISSLKHEGQNEPAVITADGFLINGNRRKMALDKLLRETGDIGKYSYMKVVILPNIGESGGEPTNVEIELLENAYQFHHDGKSEYYNFDRAISIRRKERKGISLEQQLKHDSRYATLDEKSFAKAVKKYRDEFLGPLGVIDDYLQYIGHPGDYSAISGHKGDPLGRWQAFLDYYNSVGSKLGDSKGRLALGIEEREVGIVKDAAYKTLRQRSFGEGNEIVPKKINDVMRSLPKILLNANAKKELLKLSNVPVKDKETRQAVTDEVWARDNHVAVINHVTQAFRTVNNKHEQEEPLQLLQKALTLLSNPAIDPESVGLHDLTQAVKILDEIQEQAKDLKAEFWNEHKRSTTALKNLQAKG